ncbi:MAG TPA: FAD-dependent oxidoreductase [Rhodopila sp.]|uniref:NAD(P)/FAD-dependent oxidoreductase n=1 Tax=Rhodopila sp. TaxID=2480087 RepID=UPI002B6FA699|nr:FAD-dependent oxidoreductase [Rhodopila sp.]HVY15004.1 FAD-dependent oxidoreductase [Rhodopila sp.]
MDQQIVIVGAGHAGGSAAAMLRQAGWTGGITLIGDEPIPPYERPPLSKAWLKGEATAESLALRPAAFYPDSGIALRLETTVSAIDRAGKAVMLSGGTRLPYDILILATGARARRLPIPGSDLQGVLELRSAADADALKAALRPGARLAVIGGGYIGLEVAASARALGAEAVIVERESRVLARVACPLLSQFFHDFHVRQGVAIETGVQVEALTGTRGMVSGVRVGDGRVVACDAALVGVGAIANDDLAREAGLACANGIVVDLAARTDDPAIYAIGDCTVRPLPLYGRTGRLESVPNALEQAKQAAHAICGKPAPAPEVPWFWSDQYDLRLQIAGIPFDTAEIVVRGDVSAGKFALFHLTDTGVVQAVEAVNASMEFMGGRRIIARRKALTRARIEDLSVSMQQLAA